jgi:hypothetical protein
MGRYGEYGTIPGLIATGDLSSNQFYVVKAGSTAKTVKVATTKATDLILGVLQNDPASGEAAEVAAWGVCLALAEASVTYGAKVTCSTTGRVTLVNADKDETLGIALCDASTSAGDLIPVLLSRFEASV